jgi:membrane associated rhomboid family serine protease
MSFENRDYLRDEQRRYGGLSGAGGGGGVPGVSANLPPMTLWLLILTVMIGFIDAILTGSMRGGVVSPSRWGHFSVESGLAGLQLWRLVTYQFLHSGILHLLFNMIGLWVFGGLIERFWGPKRFLAFYLLCGIGGALLFAAATLVPGLAMIDAESTLIGASGCILGCVTACMVKYPKQPIGLFFIPVSFTIFALGAMYLALDLLRVVAGSEDAGSAVAHLGGAIIGFLLIKKPSLLNAADRFSTQAIQDVWKEKRFKKKRQKEGALEQEIDRILVKVKEQGIASLTKKEKKTLASASEQKRRG